MRFLYSAEQVSFLETSWKAMRLPALTLAFNAKFGTEKTEKQIKAAVKNRKFTCGRPRCMPRGESRLMTKAEFDRLIEIYQDNSIDIATDLFNAEFGKTLTKAQIRSRLKNQKITCGRTGHFQKGIIPWTSSVKGKGVLKANKGSFKHGLVPANRLPLGSERIDVQSGHVMVKVAEKCPWTGRNTRYKHKHVVIWEQANGPVPHGHLLRFSDSNPLNCTLENLELITLQANALLNRKYKLSEVPAEFKKTVILTAKLDAKVQSLEKAPTNKGRQSA